MNKAQNKGNIFGDFVETRRSSPGLTQDGCFGHAACMLLGQTKWDRGCCQASWRSLSRAERTGRLWGFWIPLMLRQGAQGEGAPERFLCWCGLLWRWCVE